MLRTEALVVRFGVPRALRFAQWLHAAMFAMLIVFGIVAQLGVVYFAAMPLIVGALLYEHRAAARFDLAAINRAFFQSNAFVSAVFLLAVAIDLLSRR